MSVTLTINREAASGLMKLGLTPESELDDQARRDHNLAVVRDFARGLKAANEKKLAAVEVARPALARLVEVCRAKTGQSRIVRSLLYSLWHGKPTSLLELLGLDYNVRCDVLAVCAAFGFETLSRVNNFFYAEIRQAFAQAGLFDWFTEEDAEA